MKTKSPEIFLHNFFVLKFLSSAPEEHFLRYHRFFFLIQFIDILERMSLVKWTGIVSWYGYLMMLNLCGDLRSDHDDHPLWWFRVWYIWSLCRIKKIDGKEEGRKYGIDNGSLRCKIVRFHWKIYWICFA